MAVGPRQCRTADRRPGLLRSRLLEMSSVAHGGTSRVTPTARPKSAARGYALTLKPYSANAADSDLKRLGP